MDFAVLKRLTEEELPFNKFLGIQVLEFSEGLARMRLPFKPELIGDPRRPALHGGVISTLVDLCGGFAVWTRCRLDDRLATIDLGVDYLRPAPAAPLIAEGTVRLLGNRVGNAQVIVWSEGAPDEHLAVGRGVYNIRRGK
jgi:uncharacterized protein (TIGR00369 family)